MASITSQASSVPVRTRLYTFYRSTLFNAIIIGLVSFTQPGIWSALAGECLLILNNSIVEIQY
jgi:hypothetical protein